MSLHQPRFSYFFYFFRRNLDYHQVLDNLKDMGIAIRVASPKLVMEEVWI